MELAESVLPWLRSNVLVFTSFVDVPPCSYVGIFKEMTELKFQKPHSRSLFSLSYTTSMITSLFSFSMLRLGLCHFNLLVSSPLLSLFEYSLKSSCYLLLHQEVHSNVSLSRFHTSNKYSNMLIFLANWRNPMDFLGGRRFLSTPRC